MVAERPGTDRLRRRAGHAAWLNAGLSVAMAAVAMLWIGPEALSDPRRMAAEAVARPAAFFAQDALKLGSVAVSLVLILTLAQLMHLPRAGIFVLSGLAAEGALSLNAVLSVWALMSAEPASLLALVGGTARLSLALSGAWLLLACATGRRHARWPLGLVLVGSLGGAGSLLASFLPPAGLVALVFGIWWSLWLARWLFRTR